MKRTGTPAARNVDMFVSMLMFNYLIAAPDAYAKNYSLLLDRESAYLVPAYDIASMIPYADRLLDVKIAMGIAGENRVARLSARRLGRFVDANGLEAYGLTADVLVWRLEAMAVDLPSALEVTLEEYARIPGMDELASRLLPGVKTLCEKSLGRLHLPPRKTVDSLAE